MTPVSQSETTRGRTAEEAKRRADDPDFYEEAFFVPEHARWTYLQNAPLVHRSRRPWLRQRVRPWAARLGEEAVEIVSVTSATAGARSARLQGLYELSLREFVGSGVVEGP